MRRGWLLFIGVAMLPVPCLAATPVIDATAIATSTIERAKSLAQTILIVNNGLAQLVQLKNTFEAISHGNLAAIATLGPELGALGLSNPFSGEATELVQALSGLAGSAGATGVLAQQLLQTDTYYLPTSKDFGATALAQGAMANAAAKALAQRGMEAADARLKALSELRKKLDETAKDTAGAGQATARLAGETAVGVVQTNQLLASDMMTRATKATSQAQVAQKLRQDVEAVMAGTQSDADALGVGKFGRDSSGQVSTMLVASSDSSSWTSNPFDLSGTSSSAVDSSGMMDSSNVAASTGSTDALAGMQAQNWGSDAARIATTQGIDPNALAATCMVESNCDANARGSGTISGAFQMRASTQSADTQAALTANPSLASYVSTGGATAQAVAASQELKTDATTLQGLGVANPTLLQARTLYQWGAGAGPGVALASDSQTMASVLPQYTASQLAANGVSQSMTVGQWRSSVAAKLGPAASQPVLASGNS